MSCSILVLQMPNWKILFSHSNYLWISRATQGLPSNALILKSWTNFISQLAMVNRAWAIQPVGQLVGEISCRPENMANGTTSMHAYRIITQHRRLGFPFTKFLYSHMRIFLLIWPLNPIPHSTSFMKYKIASLWHRIPECNVRSYHSCSMYFISMFCMLNSWFSRIEFAI